MKELLEDSEISHPLNEALLKEAEEIKADRKMVKDRLDKLEETRSSVSESVFQKVRADYAGKMNRTTERLVALKKDLEAEERKVLEKKLLVESNLKLHAEKIEEATLRHALGEFTADEHNEIRRREEKEIDRLEAAVKTLAEGLERHRGIFAGEDLPPAAAPKPEKPPERPSEKPVEKPKPAATPSAAASRAAPSAPAAPQPPEHTPSPTIRESSAPKQFASLTNPAIESTAKIRLEERQTGTVTAVDRAAGSRKSSELAVLENGKVIQTVVLDHNVYIGRSPSNDVVLKEPKVSRKHAEIQNVNGKYVLLDLESSNGTFVGGKKIAEYTLQPNDEIVIGNTKMVFKG
ncbi:MAG TPA: FHA domain-containing protein [bacterium]|nr:FHA domain-containing protein [bacterium]